jgi:hypothetical protein
MQNIANAAITHETIDKLIEPVFPRIVSFLKKIPAPTVDPTVNKITDKEETRFLLFIIINYKIMKKPVCFLFDSSSSIKEGEFSDTFVLPLQVSEVTDNGEVNYKDGVNIFTKEIEKQLIENKSFKTSSSSAADILQKFEELSKLYEHIYVFLIPFTLSQGQTNVVSNIAEDFPNVTVIPHYMVALMAR